jgi:hypothetical protein
MILLASLPYYSESQYVLDASEKEQVYALLTQGYEAMSESPANAIPYFQQAVAIDPSNVDLRKQLGSTFIAVGRLYDALIQFSIADYLSPSDSTKIQIAYLLNSLGMNTESYKAFYELHTSGNDEIRKISRDATTVLDPVLTNEQYPWWGGISLTPYYDSRFDNTIVLGLLDVGYHLDRSRLLSLLGTLRISRDTRSEGGAVPVIFSDNYVLAAAGLRVNPFKGFFADVLGGVTTDLDTRPDQDQVRGDFRTVLSYGAGVFARATFPEGLNLTAKPWADTYTSVGYYSRYNNVIGYTQGKAGLRFLEVGYLGMDIYARVDFAWDSAREFYNNVAEGSVGLRLVPQYAWGISLLAEFHRGFYWDQSLSTGDISRWYSSNRFFLVFERSLSF